MTQFVFGAKEIERMLKQWPLNVVFVSRFLGLQQTFAVAVSKHEQSSAGQFRRPDHGADLCFRAEADSANRRAFAVGDVDSLSVTGDSRRLCESGFIERTVDDVLTSAAGKRTNHIRAELV